MTDALSAVLDLLDLRAAASARFEAAGDWGLTFPRPGQLKIIAVLAGQCWVTSAGAEPIGLAVGDCVLLAGDRAFTAASGPDQDALPQPVAVPSPWPATVYYQTTKDGTEPGRTVLVSGRITVDRYAAGLLLDDLPPAVRITGPAAARNLAPVLDMLSAEAAQPDSPGSITVRRQLTQVLAVHVLRAVLAEQPALSPGWLSALADQRIGAALTVIHNQPQHRWTVAELAQAAAMSRSAFSARFHELVGTPPLEYLTSWRMQRAAHALRSTTDPVARIGGAVGYPVESTFNTTFKRVIGTSPGRYRREFADNAATTAS